MTATDSDRPGSEALCGILRRSRTFRELAPMEAAIGWPLPVPVLQDGAPRVHVGLPLFVMRPDPAGDADLRLTVTTTGNDLLIVLMTDGRF